MGWSRTLGKVAPCGHRLEARGRAPASPLPLGRHAAVGGALRLWGGGKSDARRWVPRALDGPGPLDGPVLIPATLTHCLTSPGGAWTVTFAGRAAAAPPGVPAKDGG